MRNQLLANEELRHPGAKPSRAAAFSKPPPQYRPVHVHEASAPNSGSKIGITFYWMGIFSPFFFCLNRKTKPGKSTLFRFQIQAKFHCQKIENLLKLCILHNPKTHIKIASASDPDFSRAWGLGSRAIFI